jgi:hypothetical protein
VDVQVLRTQPASSCPEGDYVRVHTCSDPGDDTVTLATIERVTDRVKGGASKTRVKPLVVRQRMSPDDALGLATRYAERKHIAVVYADAARR